MSLVLVFNCRIKGEVSWIPIDGSDSKECVTITTIESNDDHYLAKIEVHGFYDNPITIEGIAYHQLSFDDPAMLCFIGEPALPVISKLIALPKGEVFDLEIRDEKWSDNILIGQIMPRQESFFETEDVPPFVKNNTIYSGDLYQTEKVHIGELHKWRGINNRTVSICPIRYMPREGKMSVLKEFVLELSFHGRPADNPFRPDDMQLFLNKLNSPAYKNAIQQRDSTDSYDYLIIVGNISGILECQALADFRKWKAFMGYKTKVVSTNTIGTTADQIKQYISSEYLNHSELKYLLFIGDYDMIPMAHNSSNAVYGDYWYGCTNEYNVYANISIGRFSTNDLSELSNMVNKTISYESSPRNYGSEVLLVAHKNEPPKYYRFCSESIRNGNYDECVSFTTAYGDSISHGGDSATNAYVVSEINEGKNIINYRGHGDYNCWSVWNINNESFYDTQISSLYYRTNDIYFCTDCLNGDIEHTCLMETFMRSNHGAAGIIAATSVTDNTANDSYNKYLFSMLFNQHIYNIGRLNLAAHIKNISTSSSYIYPKAIYNALSYLCGCDPSLEIISGNTEFFDNYSLSLNGSNLTINSGTMDGYKVSVVNEDGSLLFFIDSISSSCTFPIPTVNSYIVLNKHNYIPRILYLNVTDNYIQDKVFHANDNHYYINNGTISVGYDVTNSLPSGNVRVENGSKLNIKNSNGVFIKNGFECELGGVLEIKN